MVPNLLRVDDMNVRITNNNNSHFNIKVEGSMCGKASSSIRCGSTIHRFPVVLEVVGIREEEVITKSNTLRSTEHQM